MGFLQRIGTAAALLLVAGVTHGSEPPLDDQVRAHVRDLLDPDDAPRRRALDELRRIGPPALPAILTSAGRAPGTPEWEAALLAALQVDAEQALAHVETCRTQWGALGWLAPTGKAGRRVVDELEDRLLAGRAWSKPVRLQPALASGGFRVPHWVETRLVDALPNHLAWDDVPVRVRGGKLEVDLARDGKFQRRVDETELLEIGPADRERHVLVYRRLDAWYAASPYLLRGSADGRTFELMDVQADGDFAGPDDLIRFGDDAFRPLREGPLAFAGDGLLRFRVRREASGHVLQFLPEPEPVWADLASVRGVKALARWRAAAGFAPARIDRERSSRCALHHEYWRRNGFSGHDQDPEKPGHTSEGAQAGKQSSVANGSDGPAFVETIGATVLHRASVLGRPEEGVGFHSGSVGSLLWGGTIHAAQRGLPLVVPASGQVGVPLLCNSEKPPPSRWPDFYKTRERGFPVSVTWSGIADRALAEGRIEVFEHGAAKPLPGTTFSPETPYSDDRVTGYPAESVIFVADAPLRAGTLHTVRYRGRGRDGVVEFTWQFRTR